MPRPRTSQYEILPVAANIAAMRQARDWSQIELARRLGVNVSQVARIEIGKFKPTLELIMACVREFGVTPNELFRAPGQQSEMERDFDQLITDIRGLDDQQQASVRKLVAALKAGYRVLVRPYPTLIDEQGKETPVSAKDEEAFYRSLANDGERDGRKP